MKRLVIIIAAILFCLPALAQADRKEVRSGNRKFRRNDVQSAEIDYRKAIMKDSTSVAGNYNLASALYRQEDYDGAQKSLEKVKEQASAGAQASDYHYNAGDVALQRKDYAAAVEEFKQSLLANPGDLDAKENYIYAKKMLENQQNGGGGQNNQDQNQDKDQNQDQDQNQNQNQDRNQNQDQNQDQNNQNKPDQQEGDGEQPQSGISRQQAQQMLNAVQAQEKKTQDKVNKEKAAQLQSRQKEKDW